MKVLLDAEVMQIPVTGVARSTLGLYSACRQLAPETELIAVHRKPLTCELPAGARERRLMSFLSKPMWRRIAIPCSTAQEAPDVVHFPWNGRVPRMWGGAVVATTYHDLIQLALPNLYFRHDGEQAEFRLRVQRDMDRTDLVLTDSECSKRDILKNFRVRSEPVVVYFSNALPVDGPDAGNGHAVPGVPDSFFVNHGGYDARKGIDVLVRVYSRLFSAGQVHIPLVLVGSAVYFSDEFKADIERAKVMGAVIETGYLADGDVVALLRRARGLICPTLYEGFGFPPLEAMACGCPVISTNTSSLPEVCGTAALYVRPGHDEDLAKAIVEMDEKLRTARLSEGVREEAGAEVFLVPFGRDIPGCVGTGLPWQKKGDVIRASKCSPTSL